MRSVRIFLLRVLLSSWMAPGPWLVVWPLVALLSGVKDANRVCVDVSKTYWNGVV